MMNLALLSIFTPKSSFSESSRSIIVSGKEMPDIVSRDRALIERVEPISLTFGQGVRLPKYRIVYTSPIYAARQRKPRFRF